jgi:hypothetical protein
MHCQECSARTYKEYIRLHISEALALHSHIHPSGIPGLSRIWLLHLHSSPPVRRIHTFGALKIDVDETRSGLGVAIKEDRSSAVGTSKSSPFSLSRDSPTVTEFPVPVQWSNWRPPVSANVFLVRNPIVIHRKCCDPTWPAQVYIENLSRRHDLEDGGCEYFLLILTAAADWQANP